MFTVYIGSDHTGFILKEGIEEYLKEAGYFIRDLGPYQLDSEDDFPDYAKEVCKRVAKDDSGIAILICGTGQGMAIAANKINGVRAAVCWNKEIARQAREHLDTNVLCLGADYLDIGKAKGIIEIFLRTKLSERERYSRRIEKITGLEK
jgi:ribose 5-phosphate isomerase B